MSMPPDPFEDYREPAAQTWRMYTAAVAAFLDAGFSEEQSKELAYALILAALRGNQP